MIQVERKSIYFKPDPTRVILKSYLPDDVERIKKILKRLLTLKDTEVVRELEQVLKHFGKRHKQFEEILLKNFESAISVLGTELQVVKQRKLLIGAYFSMEYSIESSAFFNPSIVPHDDQSMCKEGEIHIVISFRATGEGHLSSIAFRTGFIDAKNNIRINPVNRFVGTPEQIVNKHYNKVIFQRKLKEIGVDDYVADRTLRKLNMEFSNEELSRAIEDLCDIRLASNNTIKAFEGMLALARANYEIIFDKNTHICERVIFPISHTEKRGIEDARFVQFTDSDGSRVYYATYSAYDGHIVTPQILETHDFIHFKMMTLNGFSVKNKGLALFPRKIGGFYTMISRIDNENLYIMSSDNVLFWDKAEFLYAPTEPWEMVQIGNCGSPVETEKGWILLTHGVGAMRSYSIGAILLDKNDPYRVIGRLREPLLVATEEEREGYVPNVVYSCGSMIHNESLIISYAMSDFCSSIAIVKLDELLDELKKNPA